MSPKVLEIRIANSGQNAAASTDPFFLEIIEEEVSLGELIKRTVEEEIRVMLYKRNFQESQAREILSRRYLTATEINDLANMGKISLPAAEICTPISQTAEVVAALHAFEQKRYVVFVNGRQIDSLDERLTFTEQNRITFLRLLPLVGG